MRHWYALYTKPRAERLVNQALQARDIETYLPTVQVWRARRRRREEEPLFTCYLFARIDLRQVGISAIARRPGLRRIVGGETGGQFLFRIRLLLTCVTKLPGWGHRHRLPNSSRATRFVSAG